MQDTMQDKHDCGAGFSGRWQVAFRKAVKRKVIFCNCCGFEKENKLVI